MAKIFERFNEDAVEEGLDIDAGGMTLLLREAIKEGWSGEQAPKLRR